MNDSFEFTLHSPLTEDDWNKISDAELEHTESVTFQTPQGRQVRYIKCEVLDKIRAEILGISSYEGFELGGVKDGYRIAMVNILDIIDKYKAKSEIKK